MTAFIILGTILSILMACRAAMMLVARRAMKDAGMEVRPLKWWPF